MLSYLEKFHSLPSDLQDHVSTPAVMQAIADIERKYGVSLAAVVMKVMVRDVSLVDLPKLLVFEFGLDGKTARQVVEDLKEFVFTNVSEYLGIAKEAVINIDRDEKFNNYMGQKQAEAGIRSSTFFFSSEDEEEIKNLTTKLADPEVKLTDYTEVNNKIAMILPALQINFSSVEMTERLKKILLTYLRGVRNKIDTRQTLMKPVDSGGMGLDTFLADKILTITDKINSEAPPGPKPELPKEKPSEIPKTETTKPRDIDELIARMKQTGVRDVDYDFSKLTGINPSQSASELTKVPQQVQEAIRPATPVKTPEPVVEKINDKDIVLNELTRQGVGIGGMDKNKFVTDLRPEDQLRSALDQPAFNSGDVKTGQRAMSAPTLNLASKRIFAGREGRSKMSDVKFVPKLVGPIDELAEMDLVNFRRLNDDPRVGAATIKEKISFLEEDSYGQKLAGIKAWRQSPLNRLYINIGHESISQKTGIDEAMVARKNADKEYLMPEEFYAIMDLNKSLRF